jgi:hypothetical protein
MKNQFHNYFAILFAFFGIFSCTKTDVETLPSNNTSTAVFIDKIKADGLLALQSKANPKESVENQSNKYDYVGQQHNKTLDAIIFKYDAISNDKVALSFLISNPNARTGSEFSATYTSRTEKTIAISGDYWFKNQSNLLNGESFAPKELIDYTNSNINYLKNNKFPNPSKSSDIEVLKNISQKLDYFNVNLGLSDVEKNIENAYFEQLLSCNALDDCLRLTKSYESNIIASSLDDKIKARQLVFMSIMRHSTSYWEKVQNDTSSNWHKLYGNLFNGNSLSNTRVAKKWWEWLIIGVADGVGGLAGALVSSPVGAAFVGGAVGGVASGLADDLIDS